MIIMSYNLLLVSVVLFVQSAAAAPNNAPWKQWTFCKVLDDPKMNNECVVKALKETEETLINGNSYFGTPPLDPLRIDKISVAQSNQKDKAVAVDIEFTNIDIIGLGSWNLLAAGGDWEKKDGLFAEIKMNKPIRITSDYKISGKVILLPINGQGKADILYDDMICKINLKGKVIKKKNSRYFSLEKVDVDTSYKKMTIKLDNLFNGNKALGDNMNKFLNENWKEVSNEFKGPFQEAIAEAYKQLAIRVFNKIPFDILSPK